MMITMIEKQIYQLYQQMMKILYNKNLKIKKIKLLKQI